MAKLYVADVSMADQNRIWIRFGMEHYGTTVTVKIKGGLLGNQVRNFSLGNLRAGNYADKGQALFWNRLDDVNIPFADDDDVKVTLTVNGVKNDEQKIKLWS
jgi:hypothetical protein